MTDPPNPIKETQKIYLYLTYQQKSHNMGVDCVLRMLMIAVCI